MNEKMWGWKGENLRIVDGFMEIRCLGNKKEDEKEKGKKNWNGDEGKKKEIGKEMLLGNGLGEKKENESGKNEEWRWEKMRENEIKGKIELRWVLGGEKKWKEKLEEKKKKMKKKEERKKKRRRKEDGGISWKEEDGKCGKKNGNKWREESGIEEDIVKEMEENRREEREGEKGDGESGKGLKKWGIEVDWREKKVRK